MSSVFRSIPEVVPAGQVGKARVEHFTVNRSESMMSAIRGESVRPGSYARLYVGGTLYMSDTSMEHRTNYQVVRRAHGHVLIAGLGLGMILTAILDDEEVTAVTVVEKYQDVIDLVAPHHQHHKLTVVCADIFEWTPPKGTAFDVAYFDIWPDICTDNLKEMTALHRRYGRWMNKNNPHRWMDSWCRGELKAQLRREKRSSWY